MIKCDRCHKTNKGRYRTITLSSEDKRFKPTKIKTKVETWCYDCLESPVSTGKTEKQLWEEINTPFWKLMGQKPKPKDIALEKHLKSKGMTYGDWRKAREFGVAKNPSAFPKFEEHYKKYGRNNDPTVKYEKR